MTSTKSAVSSLSELFDLDHVLTDDERDLQRVTRRYVRQRIKPNAARWFEAGDLPVRELAKGWVSSACSVCTCTDTAAPAPTR